MLWIRQIAFAGALIVGLMATAGSAQQPGAGAGGQIRTFDCGGSQVGAPIQLQGLGENSVQTAAIHRTDICRLEVELAGDGALTSISFASGPPDITFEVDGVGSPLSAGQIIDDEFAALGVQFTSDDPVNHPAMIFDSANPTGGDFDLGTPNEDFGGPGNGAGGEAGQAGENNLALGNVLILSEDGDSSDPDDNEAGGTIIATFNEPVSLKSVGLLDIGRGTPSVPVSGPVGLLGIALALAAAVAFSSRYGSRRPAPTQA